MTELTREMALAKLWASPDAARMFLKRRAQVCEGLVVTPNGNGEFCLRPPVDEAAQPEPTVMATKVSNTSKTAKITTVRKVPAKPPVLEVRSAKAHDKGLALSPPTPAPVVTTDPTGGLTMKGALLVIQGLPPTSSALTWAEHYAKKLNLPIEVWDERTNTRVATIDAEWLRSRKAAKAAAKPKGKATGTPREAKVAPEGKRLEIIKLAMRKQGVSTKELVDATSWKGCPWKWTFSNPQGKGLCDRYGYGFEAKEVDGTVRYFVTAPQLQAAE